MKNDQIRSSEEAASNDSSVKTTNANKVSNRPNLESLKDGDSLLVTIRKVAHTKGDPSKGFKASIELAQFIENPERPTSAVSMLNADDDRFAKKRPQHAFQPVSVSVAIAAGWITEKDFDALKQSTGVPIEQQVEDEHYKVINQLNPKFNGKRLVVQILETTDARSQGARAKINPSSGVTVTHNGKPVYRISQVAFEGSVSSFLASDGTMAKFGASDSGAENSSEMRKQNSSTALNG